MGIVFQLAGTHDHYFLAEKEGEYITIVQSFQNTYTVNKSIEQLKCFHISDFIKLLNKFTSIDRDLIYQIFFAIPLQQQININKLNYILLEKG